jgi:hypothetical protein
MSADRRTYPRAKLKWPVKIRSDEEVMDGVTLDITPDGCFISCRKPLKLNVVFELAIKVPNSKAVLQANAEVVWSNIYGPDDEISPQTLSTLVIDLSEEKKKIPSSK